MKNSLKISVYIIAVALVSSCATSNPGGSSAIQTKVKDYSQYPSMYDALSSVSGIQVRRSGLGRSGGQDNRNNSGIEVSIRGSQSATNTNEPLFVLNGIPLGRSFDTISHLNPVIIEDIRVQRGLAATNRWGSEGNSGAILVITKN